MRPSLRIMEMQLSATRRCCFYPFAQPMGKVLVLVKGWGGPRGRKEVGELHLELFGGRWRPLKCAYPRTQWSLSRLGQWFSNYSLHPNHQEGLLKQNAWPQVQSLWFSLMWGPRILISSKFSGRAAAGPSEHENMWRTSPVKFLLLCAGNHTQWCSSCHFS